MEAGEPPWGWQTSGRHTHTLAHILGLVCAQEDILDPLTRARPVVRIRLLSFAPGGFAPSLQETEEDITGYNPGLKTAVTSWWQTRERPERRSTALQEVAYPARMQNLQPVDERHYALLQRVQRVLLRVVVSEVVPQTPESIPEQLDLLSLQTHRGQTQTG